MLEKSLGTFGIALKTAAFQPKHLAGIGLASASILAALAAQDGVDPLNYRREFIGLVQFPEGLFTFALQQCKQGCLHLKNCGVKWGQLGHAGLLIPAQSLVLARMAKKAEAEAPKQ
jgi:hypothetical protein